MTLETIIVPIIGIVGFVVLAPIVGCLLAGFDRKLSARMQGRVGPKIAQPWWDFRKLLEKDKATVNGAQDLYVVLCLVCIVIAGAVFFAGGNFLLCLFIQTLGELFLILAAYSTRSPYAELGAERELIQVMAYEPMVLLVAIGLFMVTGSFDVNVLGGLDMPIICSIPLIFIGFLYVLTIKLRKSPFDISMAQHAHQELVRGVSTEFSGRTLALLEMTHWYESILFLGWVGMFAFWNAGWVGIVVAVVVALVTWIIEIAIDNNFARVTWQTMLKSAWWVALALGTVNIAYLLFI